MAEFGFLADDLTGASDVLAQAHAYGLEAMLVLNPDHAMPDEADVVGIAGPARSLAGTELDAAVRSGLVPLASLGLSVLLYKVCSTFDSSPIVGSIGRAIELLHERFPRHGAVPVVPAQPGFGRYTAFSQHFGVYTHEVYRLDRHPVMSHHPSTPMSEADLRLVLADQFTKPDPVGALQLPAYGDGTFAAQWNTQRDRDQSAFVVDAVDEAHMDQVAAALTAGHPEEGPSLVVGSGGIMAALARASGERRRAPGPTTSTGPTLVVSASASATTATQIDDAVRRGWIDVPITPAAFQRDSAHLEWAAPVEAALRAGRNVVAHTTRGPSDPRLAAAQVSAAEVGGTIGRLAGEMAKLGLTRDVVICGGDTSSHALLALGVNELRVSEQFVTAGPICVTDSEAAVAGCRVLLKGGQVGPPDLFAKFAGEA